jgi:hypothetical protein
MGNSNVVVSGLIAAGVLESARRATGIPNATASQAIRYWLAIGSGRTPDEAKTEATATRPGRPKTGPAA